MEVAHRIIRFIRNLHISTKIFISFVLLILVFAIILSYRYMSSSMKTITELSEKNVYEIVKQDNQFIDSELAKIDDASLSIATDKILYDALKEANSRNNFNMLEMDRSLKGIINEYMPTNNNIYSTNIITREYTFGDNRLNIPYKDFYASDIYKSTLQLGGRLQWVPTYDFINTFGKEYKNKAKFDYRYIFSAVRLLNSSYVVNGISFVGLGTEAERPVFISNIDENIYRDVFKKSIPEKESYYFVADSNGYVISHSDINKTATIIHDKWYKKILDKGSGYGIVDIDNKKMIICYDASKVTGWIFAVVISPDKLTGELMSDMKSYNMKVLFVAVAASMVVSFMIALSITKPVKKLVFAFKRAGEGDFSTKITGTQEGEIGYLINKFNAMNERVKLLIDENYLTKIREKETQIMALNIQLNPHFLYNTLNIINWIAIENKQDEISRLIVSLSSMLQYTARNQEEMVPFIDDLRWLENYVYIMQCRFEGKFVIQYDIENRLNNKKVPKLFLEPFIENSIIHGFENMETGGIINVTGNICGEGILFCIKDNGRGMSKDEICYVMNNSNSSIGIKNVDKRIKLIYGEEYGVKIKSEQGFDTQIFINIPLNTN